MDENELNQAKIKEENAREREEDIRQQNEYSRLQKELEDEKEREKKDREEKIKKIMTSYADTVIKDQKEQIRMEDEKMLKHIKNQIRKEEDDDVRRKQKQLEQQKDMRDYLARQVEEKKLKEEAENEINKLQAEIWRQDVCFC